MKLSRYNLRFLFFGTAVLTTAFMTGCKPEAHNEELGAVPDAAFVVTPVSGKINTYLLSSSTPGAFYYKWDLGDGGDAKIGNQIDTAYYAEKGTYTVKLLVLGQGGYDTVSQVITVTEDDPAGCAGSKASLTNCSEKTWVLDQPGGGALWVGDPNGGQWWSNGEGDVKAPDRTCLFNDEYTFKKDGTFLFDDKGDMRVDDEGGAPWPTDIGLAIGCYGTTQIPAKYQPWGSGAFTYKIVGNKLQVIGKGAHLGLYKVGENGTTATPDETITYDILELTDTKMVVRKLYSWGQWKFTFKAK